MIIGPAFSFRWYRCRLCRQQWRSTNTRRTRDERADNDRGHISQNLVITELCPDCIAQLPELDRLNGSRL